MAQQDQLRHLLSQQDFWTLPQIGQLIEQHFTARYSPSGLRRSLKRMNLYHYKPQPRDYRRTPTAQQQLQTRLQATVDAVRLREESLRNLLCYVHETNGTSSPSGESRCLADCLVLG